MKKVFTIYFDKEYYRWAPLLIQSLAVHDPEAIVHAHGVNLDVAQVEELRGFMNVGVVDTYEIADEKEISHEFSFQMIERKAHFFRQTFDRYPDADFYILMDVDTLVVNPLKKLDKFISKFDMAGVMTNPEKIMGGFLVAKNVPVVKEYWRELDEFLMDGGGFYYNKDQPAIFRLYRKYKNRIRFLPLGLEYLNIWSEESPYTYIWSAHKLEYGDKNERYSLYREKLGRM